MPAVIVTHIGGRPLSGLACKRQIAAIAGQSTFPPPPAQPRPFRRAASSREIAWARRCPHGDRLFSPGIRGRRRVFWLLFALLRLHKAAAQLSSSGSPLADLIEAISPRLKTRTRRRPRASRSISEGGGLSDHFRRQLRAVGERRRLRSSRLPLALFLVK
jgi:hypothetical protein